MKKKELFKKIEVKLDTFEVEEMATFGLTLKQMADIKGISHDTLERRLKESDELRASLNKGRAAALAKVGKTAYEMAIDGKNPGMTQFYLKVRGRGEWQETQVIDNRHEIKEPPREVTEENIPDLIYQAKAVLEALLDKQREIELKRIDNARLVSAKKPD